MATLKSGQAQYKRQGSNNNFPNQDILKKLEGKVLSARILSIDQSGTSINGTSSVQLLQEVQLGGSDIINGVLPFFPNLKNYPLVNETVLIIGLANKEYKNNFNNLTFYYLSPLNLWNSNQTNPIPYPTTKVTSNSQGKSYQEVEQTGNPNKPLETVIQHLNLVYILMKIIFQIQHSLMKEIIL